MLNIKDCSVLILSCDSYSDLWLPFFTLLNKYWKRPYKTYLSCETKQCEYCNTINVNDNCWTKRIRETLKQINTEYVIIMCEDFFMRKPVDQKRIETAINRFDDNTATFNFEKDYSTDNGSNDFRLRDNKEQFTKSCQTGVWDRLKLIELLNKDLNPWEWEESPNTTNYKCFINTGDLIFDYGFYNHNWFGVVKGKWIMSDIDPLFKKENIDIDYSIRGISKEIK